MGGEWCTCVPYLIDIFFPLLAGGGYSWDLGGTRILLNTNISIKQLDGKAQNNVNFSIGGLF